MTMTLSDGLRKYYIDFVRSHSAAMSEFISSNHASAYLDVCTTIWLARATVWDFGSCDLEIIETDGAALIYWKNYEFKDWEAARTTIERFFDGVLNSQLWNL